MVIDSASPPVSPSVVAAILMTQNISVTAGTLLDLVCEMPFMPSVSGGCGAGCYTIVPTRQTPELGLLLPVRNDRKFVPARQT